MNPTLKDDLEKLVIRHINKSSKDVPLYAVENYIISCLENQVNSIRAKELKDKIKR